MIIDDGDIVTAGGIMHAFSQELARWFIRVECTPLMTSPLPQK